MRRGCKRRKRRRASATRGRRHAESHSAGKTGESRAATCITTDTTRSSIRSPTARKVGNWSYRQRKEKGSCATLTISRARRSSRHREDLRSRQASENITGAACITTCTNTFARVIRASAIRSIRLVRVDLWGDALSSVRGP
ncbi:unnamed protein product [Trichogramma brassicae]|uniref:Uncharacterized protein n=1 Tax=Trichogramma brassicae TaxID=86971 RepID=A0A6H5IXS2_9HYME|nr:unnamed protein product [Trichogramma brassicae]